MIKDLINIEFNELGLNGLNVHVIKKYVVLTKATDSFVTKNFSVLLIKSGQFRIRLKEITKDLHSRDLLIIPKNSFCTLLEVEDKLQLFLVSFATEFAFENSLKKELIESFHFLISASSVTIKLEKKDFLVLSLIYKLMHYVSKEYKSDGLENELQQISFNLFLYELKLIYSKYTNDSVMRLSRKESLVLDFLSIVTIHCKKQHSTNFYAGSLFITSGYLNKLVKQVTGSNAKIIIAHAIIIEAKVLLEDARLTISCIAEELEFSSAFSFSAFFKRYTTISPSEYRSISIAKFKSR